MKDLEDGVVHMGLFNNIIANSVFVEALFLELKANPNVQLVFMKGVGNIG